MISRCIRRLTDGVSLEYSQRKEGRTDVEDQDVVHHHRRSQVERHADHADVFIVDDRRYVVLGDDVEQRKGAECR